jgi:hypothetical protein
MEGWIKLHRSCLEHWLYTEYRPLTRREAWETILFTVNYEPSKCLIKGQLYDCDRGQCLLSLQSWAEKFVWSIKQVRTFFYLLEKDEMIITEGLQYTTRLTVCNYDKYQDKGQAEGTPKANGGQTEGKPRATIKEEKESKEGKEYNIHENELAISLLDYSRNYFHEKFINDNSLDTFDKLLRIDKYSPDEIKQAIAWARNDNFWSSNFISPMKLRNKDKNGVKFIDVFLTKILHNGLSRTNHSGQQRDFNELAEILHKHANT